MNDEEKEEEEEEEEEATMVKAYKEEASRGEHAKGSRAGAVTRRRRSDRFNEFI